MWEQAKAQSPHHEPMVHATADAPCPRRLTMARAAAAAASPGAESDERTD